MHWAMKECKHDQIFESQTIINLLQFKWSFLKKFAIYEIVVLMSYVTCIVWHSYYLDYAFPKILLIIFWGYFVLVEIFSFFGNFQIYFSDLMNFLYVSNLLLLGVYLIIQTNFSAAGSQSYIQHQNLMLAIINFIGWCTLIIQLRAFRQFRIFIRLITDVVRDLSTFFFFLTLIILTFATTYVVISHNPTDPDQTDASDFYRLLFMAFEFMYQTNSFIYDFKGY